MNTVPSRHADDTLEWFLRGFTAGDLAEPLLSVDDGAAQSMALAVLETDVNGVIGIRQRGLLSGWLSRAELANSSELPQCLPFDPAVVIADDAPLNEVVCLLNTHERLFVRAFGQVCGVISRSAVEKAPLRMWLFGLVTISEQRVTRIIDEILPTNGWEHHLSEGRLQKARDLQQLRRDRKQNPSLLDCLQFADKGQIVARDEALRQHTRFSSRREVERFVQALQDLRNNLAHSQDISGNWDIILELAANMHRIICGPQKESDAPAAD